MLKLLTKLRAQSLKTQVAFYYKKHGVEKPTIPLPTRPTNLQEAKFTNFIEDKNEFENVKRLIPSPIVPEPPKHSVYPTPSGWLPPDLTKSSKLPYFVLRTRFHNFPIYPIEREGGSRKLVRIRYIEGDIWEFDRDLRKFIEDQLLKNENKNMKIFSQVNELQRQVLLKGHYENYVSEFFKQCGF